MAESAFPDQPCRDFSAVARQAWAGHRLDTAAFSDDIAIVLRFAGADDCRARPKRRVGTAFAVRKACKLKIDIGLADGSGIDCQAERVDVGSCINAGAVITTLGIGANIAIEGAMGRHDPTFASSISR